MGHGIVATFVCGRLINRALAQVGDRDVRTCDSGPRRVGHGAENASKDCLARGRWYPENYKDPKHCHKTRNGRLSHCIPPRVGNPDSDIRTHPKCALRKMRRSA